MTLGLANWLTSARFVLSPFFALSLFLVSAGFPVAAVVAMWVLFALIELTDVLDGAIARRSATVTDVGKLLDPLADVVAKTSYFVTFLSVGLLPLWFVLVFLYREFGVVLIRMLLYRDGYALGARLLGKMKTWFYTLVAAVTLLRFSLDTVGRHGPGLESGLQIALTVLTVITAVLAVASFVEYLALYLRVRSGRGPDPA